MGLLTLRFTNSCVWESVPLILFQVILVSNKVTFPSFTSRLQLPLAIHCVVGVLITEFTVPFDKRPRPIKAGFCGGIGLRLFICGCVLFAPIDTVNILDSSTDTAFPPVFAVSFSDKVVCTIG